MLLSIEELQKGKALPGEQRKRFAESLITRHPEQEEEIKTELGFLEKAQRPKADLGRAIPLRGYIKEHIDYAQSQTDAPCQYHLATALSMVSATVGNRLTFKVWGGYHHPNLYLLLLGPSGIAKNTAMNIGLRQLREVMPHRGLPASRLHQRSPPGAARSEP